MTLASTTAPLPGIYPHITNITPANRARGRDYIGLGYTQHDEQFVLKRGGMVGTAEFIGAGLCHLAGIPYCQPTIVTIEHLGQVLTVFGSRIELGIEEFDQTNISAWQNITRQCSNLGAFSALLAIDLALGNDDRHWNNWMVQNGKKPDGSDAYRLRALDFSRAWPVDHPPQHPQNHRSTNTWQSMAEWSLLGVPFVQSDFDNTCTLLSTVSEKWLAGILAPLAGVYIKQHDADALCHWWGANWTTQVQHARDALNTGARP